MKTGREKEMGFPPTGFMPLRPGQLATLVTYLVHDLQSLDLQSLPARGLPPGLTLERMDGGDVARYRRLHLGVGTEYLWFSRMRMGDAALAAILDNPAVEALALVSTANGRSRDLGQLELDFRDPGHVELEYFGLCAEAIGGGLGVVLMAEALHRARQAGAEALHVHTCTFDHPRALDFYRRAGFRPIRRAIEVLDDPRLDGTLPRGAAPSIPVLEADQG